MPFKDLPTTPAVPRERRRKFREVLVAAKQRPCADCGIEYPPCVMQFDHVRGEKRIELGSATRTASNLRLILEEIAKCEVVCANCHALRTEARKPGGCVATGA